MGALGGLKKLQPERAGTRERRSAPCVWRQPPEIAVPPPGDVVM